MAKTYIIHCDAGHSWIGVKRAECRALGILARISPYSYQRGATVYLEEDIDAGLFIDAYKRTHAGARPSMRVSHATVSRVRGYEPFRAPVEIRFGS